MLDHGNCLTVHLYDSRKKLKKEIFQNQLSRKRIRESLPGVEPMIFRTPVGCSSTELQWDS